MAQSPTGGQVVPYTGGSSNSLCRVSSNSSMKDRSGSFDHPDRCKRDSGGYSTDVESPSPGRIPYCTSSPNMEGPITFVAPELIEETLMDVSTYIC